MLYATRSVLQRAVTCLWSAAKASVWGLWPAHRLIYRIRCAGFLKSLHKFPPQSPFFLILNAFFKNISSAYRVSSYRLWSLCFIISITYISTLYNLQNPLTIMWFAVSTLLKKFLDLNFVCCISGFKLFYITRKFIWSLCVLLMVLLLNRLHVSMPALYSVPIGSVATVHSAGVGLTVSIRRCGVTLGRLLICPSTEPQETALDQAQVNRLSP